MRAITVGLLGFLFLAGSPALADETIDQLTAGAALTGTELLPMFQTANPAVTTTPNALKTFIGGVQSITFGAGATGGVCTSICVTQAQELVTVFAGANPSIVTTQLAALNQLNNASNQPSAAIGGAGASGFPSGWYTDIANIGAGIQTFTPASGTIGGAATLAFPAGSATVPRSARLVSNGVSDYAILFSTLNFVAGPGSSTTNDLMAFNGTNGLTALDTGILSTNLALLTGTQTIAGAKTFSTAPIFSSITGSTQCLQVNTSGQVAGSGGACGGGGGITALTGDVTASGTGSVAATVAAIGGVAVGTPTGTGNVVFSGSPTFSGTIGGALTFSGALTLSSALTYGGVTLSNSVSGTGSMALTASPTFTGTVGAAAITATGAIITTNTTGPTLSSGQLALGGILGTPVNPGANGEGQIYLSSTNGLVIQGKGSTNDISFASSSGVVFTLATASSNFSFGGNGSITVGNAASLVLAGGLTTGTVTVKTQNNAGAASSAGNVSITAGNGTGTGASNGGNVVITAGTSTNGTAGNIQLVNVASDSAQTDSTLCLNGSNVVFKGSGTIGICLGTSSARYKHDILDLDVGLDELMGLRAISYRVNADHSDSPNKVLYGFTAENGITVLPRLAGLDEQGRPNTFDYVGLVPVLVKAVQDQQKEINDLKRLVH